MAERRRLAPAVYVAVKDATAAFLDKAFGRQKLAAAATRVGQPALSAYGNRALPDNFMPVDVLLDLIDASGGDTSLLSVVADQAGCLLVPLPVGEADDAIDAHTIRSAEDYARLVADLVRARAQGQFTGGRRCCATSAR